MMNQKGIALNLEDLPNLGSTLAQLLRESGINTPDELYEKDTFQAFIRIKAIDAGACFSKLCALESTIEGIRWHNLSTKKKSELKQFFAMIIK